MWCKPVFFHSFVYALCLLSFYASGLSSNSATILSNPLISVLVRSALKLSLGGYSFFAALLIISLALCSDTCNGCIFSLSLSLLGGGKLGDIIRDPRFL